MSRVEVLLGFLFASAAVAPWCASGQTSRPSGVTAVEQENQVRGYAAERLAPSVNSVALLPPVRLRVGPIGELPQPFTPLPQTRDRGGIPFMVAGGILFVAGAIAGGDGGTLLMVGGAGLGAYGAFVYFGGD